VLAHVVDCATLENGRDPAADIEVIEAELAAYGGLADRPRLVVLNKIDIPDARELAEMVRPDLAARGWPVFEVSAVTHEGLRTLEFALAERVQTWRAEQPAPEATRIVLRPSATDDSGFEVTGSAGEYRVTGAKPERWVRQTDFGNDEAVGFLADRLARLGVEDRLLAIGAQRGDAVAIGGGDDAVVFDFEPQIEAGAEQLMGRRGTDLRLDQWEVRGRRRGDDDVPEAPPSVATSDDVSASATDAAASTEPS